LSRTTHSKIIRDKTITQPIIKRAVRGKRVYNVVMSDTSIDGLFIENSGLNSLSIFNVDAKNVVVSPSTVLNGVLLQNSRIGAPHSMVGSRIKSLLSIDSMFLNGTYRAICFENCVFIGTVFSGCKFSDSSFVNCSFSSCVFYKCDFSKNTTNGIFHICDFSPLTVLSHMATQASQWPGINDRAVGTTYLVDCTGKAKLTGSIGRYKLSTDGNLFVRDWQGRRVEEPTGVGGDSSFAYAYDTWWAKEPLGDKDILYIDLTTGEVNPSTETIPQEKPPKLKNRSCAYRFITTSLK